MGLTDKLDLLMAERKINKAELARESGVPYTTIDGFYKKGSENAKLSTLKKLCSYFGCTLDYLADDDIKEQPTTIAAHFDGDEYTEEELDKIKEFAAFVKSTRKNEDKRAAQKAAAPAPAADAPFTFPDHLTVNAAHAIDGATQEEKQHDDDIMDNDDEWK